MNLLIEKFNREVNRFVPEEKRQSFSIEKDLNFFAGMLDSLVNLIKYKADKKTEVIGGLKHTDAQKIKQDIDFYKKDSEQIVKMLKWTLTNVLKYGENILNEKEKEQIKNIIDNIDILKDKFPFKMLFDKKYLLASSEVL